MISTRVGDVRRKVKFGAVGIAGVIVSFASLYIMIDMLGVNPSVAYAIQTVLAIETNFFGNALYTWSDRNDLPLWRRWIRFHLTRVGLMVPFNQVLFWILHPLIGTLAANAVCIAAATTVNWFLNDRMIFRAPRAIPGGLQTPQETR